MTASQATYSLPCTCDVVAGKVTVQDVEDALNNFLAANLAENTTCVDLLPWKEHRRHGTSYFWQLQLQVAPGLTGTEEVLGLAARMIGGVLKGYRDNRGLVLVECKDCRKQQAV